jgi:hypothetical protein
VLYSDYYHYTDVSKKLEIASANFIEMEDTARKAEDCAKIARMTSDAAQKVHMKLSKELDNAMGRYKTK